MQRILSPERIERFVEEQLGDREKIYASELPMETMDDFIRLIYVRLYGSRKKMRYRIEKAEGANKISFASTPMPFPNENLIVSAL